MRPMFNFFLLIGGDDLYFTVEHKSILAHFVKKKLEMTRLSCKHEL